MKNYFLFIALVLATSSTSAFAKTFPIGGGVVPIFGQVPDTEDDIKGLRINPGWGYHKTVYGVDVSIVGGTTSNQFIGTQLGVVFNSNLGSKNYIAIAQLAGVMNYNKGTTMIWGVQAGGVANKAQGKTFVYGLQAAMGANVGGNNIRGVQIGAYNEAETVSGVQIGVINKAKNLKGLQLGLVNFADNGLLPVFPVLNVGF